MKPDQYTHVTSQVDDKKVIKSWDHGAHFDISMLANITNITAI